MTFTSRKNVPLADKIRPKKLEDVYGQNHIIGEGKLLSKIVKSKNIPNIIFVGPPGTGKTTIANIIAKESDKSIYFLNGTTTNTEEIKDVIGRVNSFEGVNGILLYIDEFHYLNKKIQQNLLKYIENGDITLIGSTTENVNFTIFKAILSRCIVIEIKKLCKKDVIDGIDRALDLYEKDSNIKVNLQIDAKEYIGEISNGDMRRGLNLLDLLINIKYRPNIETIEINLEDAINSGQGAIVNYDKDGDDHYNMLSYFQKCIRGSDSQGSIHALARLIKSGDINSICRRLLVIASEDVGLAYPQAITIVKACVDSALMLGFPEARIPLAQATILLATSPKSNSAYLAINRALEDLDKLNIDNIPDHLLDKNTNMAKYSKSTYKYPHDYENHYVNQEYMPNNIKNKVYYEYQENKLEQTTKLYWDKVKKTK